MKQITSLQHPEVKHWHSLRTLKSYREEVKQVLISSKKIIEELEVEALISTTNPAADFLVTDAIMKKITGLEHPDGTAAIVKMPQETDLSHKKHLLVLDRLQDPGNLGTLLRTALGLNWDGVILTPDTVDLFNDKALRAARGATFHLPYMRIADLSRLPHTLYVADLDGAPLSNSGFTAPLALLLSNEGGGAKHYKNARKITIPMHHIESYNVASSGAILLYSLRPQ